MIRFLALALLLAISIAPFVVASESVGNSVVVHAGTSGTNGDVIVDNKSSKGVTARITPSIIEPADVSRVTTGSRFKGTITSAGNANVIELGSQNDCTINSHGGNTYLGGNSTVTVHNLVGPGAAIMTVHLQGGQTVTLPPGSTATFHT